MIPTVPQMVVRANSGHYRALRAIRAGRPVLGPTAAPSEVRGMRIVLSTLTRWQTIDEEGLTDRGVDLLTALERKVPFA